MIKKAYFSSRSELLQWVNQVQSSQIQKIQQLGSGQIYCRILEAAYPGKISLNRLKKNATLETDILHNFKILQLALIKIGIEKTIDIQRLAKFRYQQNLQLIQWMKQNLSLLISQNKQNYSTIKKNNSDLALGSTNKKSAFTGSTKKNLESKRANKENIYLPTSPKLGINMLKSHRSADKFKNIKFSENDLRRVFEKAESLKALIQPEYYGTENIQPYCTNQIKQTSIANSGRAIRQWKQKSPYKTDTFNYF